MKYRLIALSALTASWLCNSATAAEVKELAWLQGHWQSSDGAAWIEEHWVAPREGLMLGVNRSGNGKGQLAFEFIRIQADADGTPVYWASPSGSPAVPFRLEALSVNSVSFINPEHDYPAKISYSRDGNGLTATISALDGSNAMQFAWDLAE